MIDIGRAIRTAWERKIGRKITCTTCLEYLKGIGSTIPDDHAAFVLELYANLPFPASISKRLDMLEGQMLIVETMLPVMVEAGIQFEVSEFKVRKPATRKRFREIQSVFGPPRETVRQTIVYQDRFAGRCCAITSLNPNPERRARQQRCLDSWRDIGLPIIAVNTAEEIDSLRRWHPFVEFRVSDSVSTEYDRPTQRIASLIDVGIAIGLQFMLINSDIEIRGDYELIETALSQPQSLTIGVRYNHYSLTTIDESQQEKYGLDAFLMSPELAATVPDMPFAIGKPVWDYWIPHHFRSLGCGFNWINTPFFFHESHPLGWSRSDWGLGADWMKEKYGVNVGDADFRSLLGKLS